MRLGDLDALLEKVWDVDCRCGYVQVVDRVDIENAPTIDPEDLRPKGRWVEREHEDARGNYNLFHCSRCDEPNARKKNYCPNCGAKMEVNNG